MNDFRFGVNMWRVGTRDEWIAKCRRVEDLGYDTITFPDHLPMPAPFPALASAAAVTERVRVGHLVLNAAFYNPALLARDVATTIEVTGGRFDLGIGAGHMKSEFDDAGLPWSPAQERIAHVERTISELRRRLDDAGIPQPPLLVAGNSDGMLRIAAQTADIVGFAGLKHAPGQPPGTFDIADADELEERVAYFCEQAGPRAATVERNMLIQKVILDADPAVELAEWQQSPVLSKYSVDQLVAAPQLLVGTAAEIAEKLYEQRRRYGFTYFTVFEPNMEAFAEVIKVLRG
ncbi:MAG TPA: TIGR03621 family F420-dependent LLM class oxidoreductase [Actinopolymorphaceae bacterium]